MLHRYTVHIQRSSLPAVSRACRPLCSLRLAGNRQGRASPRLREALHSAACAARDAAADTSADAAAADRQQFQSADAHLDQQQAAKALATAQPADRARSPFAGSPSFQKPPASTAQHGPPLAAAPPSPAGAATQADGDRSRPRRQSSLMGAWLLPAQQPQPGIAAAPLIPSTAGPTNLPHTGPSSLRSHQPESGLAGGQQTDVCAQQEELRPFWRTSVPDVATPRLSRMAGWAELTAAVEGPAGCGAETLASVAASPDADERVHSGPSAASAGPAAAPEPIAASLVQVRHIDTPSGVSHKPVRRTVMMANVWASRVAHSRMRRRR